MHLIIKKKKQKPLNLHINTKKNHLNNKLTHSILNHHRPLPPHLPNNIQRIYRLLGLHETKRGLHEHQDAGATDSRAAVHDDGSVTFAPRLAHMVRETEEHSGGIRDAVIRPGDVLHVFYVALFFGL